MQSAHCETIAARSALLALGRTIAAALAQLGDDWRQRAAADAGDVPDANRLALLADAEGALSYAGQPGLAALVRQLRRQAGAVQDVGHRDAECGVELAANLADLADDVARLVRTGLERALRGDHIRAAELLTCWQRLSACGGMRDASPGELLSLAYGSDEPLPLPPLSPWSSSSATASHADWLAQAERALLICLRADHDSGRSAALRAFADVIAAFCAQSSCERAQVCWRVLYTYMQELAQSGGLLAVGDKKMLAATIRALRQRGRAELAAAIEPLAREALYILSLQPPKTDAGAAIIRLFAVDRQLAIPADGSCGSAHDSAPASFGAALTRAVGALERDPALIGDATLWQALADAAARTLRSAALADPLNLLAAIAPDVRDATAQECLASALLVLQDWLDEDSRVLAPTALLRQVAADCVTAGPALLVHRQAIGARRRLTSLCDTVCAELAAAEPALEEALHNGDAAPVLAATDELLRQVAGALMLCGLQDVCEGVARLRALIANVASAQSDPSAATRQLMAVWVELSATLALYPLSADVPADDVVHEGCALAAIADHDAARERLHAVFIDEARGHLRNLRGSTNAAGMNPQRADALRAAHTLAGCSATIGQAAIADLAQALESRLMLGDTLPHEALTALDRMLDEFAARGNCDPQPALLARLQIGHPMIGQTGLQTDLNADLKTDLKTATAHSTPPVDAAVAIGVCSEQFGDALLASECAVTDEAAPEPPTWLPPAFGIVPAPLVAPLPVPDAEAAALELRAIFEEEAADLLPQLEAALLAWQQQPDSREPSMQLLRVLHTLKGSARMAGLTALGDAFHQTESDINALMQQPSALLMQALPALQQRIDQWITSGLPAAQPATNVSAGASADVVIGEGTGAADGDRHGISESAVPAITSAGAGDAPICDTAAISLPAMQRDMPKLPPVRPDPASVPQLRVASGQLARVADAAAALWSGNANIHDAVQDQRHAIAALAGDLARLRTQLRELEIESESRILSTAAHGNDTGFDPLEFDRYTRLHELTRMMAESIADLSGAQRAMARQVERLASSAATQARDMRQLQLDLQAMRSQPLRAVEARLRVLLRQAARDAGREAELVLSGADVEIERGLLDRLAGPFGHLLRNAVVHGIEPPEQREARGKPRVGTVTLGAAVAGNELKLWLQDDGRGLDPQGVRGRAVAAGLIGPDDAPDEAALAALIFAPGLSTASEVTALSGRGIGLDAVRAELQSLGGRITLDQAPGQGCRFAITVPLALASLSVLLVSAGERRVALPVAQVRQVVQPAPGEIDRQAAILQIVWQGQALPLRHLGHVLGSAAASRSDDAARLPVAIMQDGDRLLGLQLDAVLGQRDVIVKHPGAQLAQVPGIAGATVLGDGSIVLILDPFRLPLAPPVAPEPVQERPLVLVVDDSLTVRRASQRLLERHGYAVTLARDGVEALERLAECRPMALLLDIEMPRMNGFELLASLRGDAALSALPVLMITSRIADRHRERAQQLGVLAYLGKPFDEETLLAHLAALRGDTQLAA